jgi:peptidylprolyl isomerase
VSLPHPPFEKVSTVRLRRSASLVVSAAVIPALAACGSTKVGYGNPTTEGFSAVSISGDVGKAPTVKWHEEMAYPKTTTVKTLVKGTGAAVGSGDSVSAYIWIGDGTTKLESYSDYSNGSPETITNDGKMGAVWTKILKGAHYGDRVAAVTSSVALLGEAGNPQLGIGTHDSLVVVVDVIKKTKPEPTSSPSASPTTPALSGPKGKAQAAPAWMPKLELSGGKTSAPKGMDFTGVKKAGPNGKLKRAILIKGTGPKVKAGQTITANYYGMVYGATAPFDESYSQSPLSSPLSSLVKGWQEGLVGVPVGSRVFLQIPPSLGYGDAAQTGIPANSTLYFVLDVLAAS